MEAQPFAELDRRHHADVSARGVENGDLEEVLLLGLMSPKLEARAAQQRDLVALRRPRGVDVVAGLARQPDGGRARRGRRFPDLAAGGVAPGHVRDPFAVGRERRRVLPPRKRRVVPGEPARRSDGPAARDLLQPHAAERLERDPPPVGRTGWASEGSGRARDRTRPSPERSRAARANCSTGAVKGISWRVPLATSSRVRWPLSENTRVFPSGRKA